MSDLLLNNDRLIILNGDKIYNPQPKILTNTEEFRTEALTFKEYGYYTKHPASTVAGMKYWKEMRRRCTEGYKRADGQWVSGDHYYYLNFSPILKVESLSESTGMKIEGFPDFWDGDEVYYNYVYEAQQNGRHVVVLKCRRRGFSWKNAAMLTRNYFLYPNSVSYAVASSKEYLFGDGLITKAWKIMDFIDGNTAWSKSRHKKNMEDHRKASYTQTVNGVEVENGYMSEIQAISLHDNISKVRGKCFGR